MFKATNEAHLHVKVCPLYSLKNIYSRPEFILINTSVDLAWENSWHFATLPLVSPPNDIWETSTEIPYWWCTTTQIWVVLLIGWIKFPAWPTNQSGQWRVSSMEFLCSFLRRNLGGETSGSVIKCWLFSQATVDLTA